MPLKISPFVNLSTHKHVVSAYFRVLTRVLLVFSHWNPLNWTVIGQFNIVSQQLQFQNTNGTWDEKSVPLLLNETCLHFIWLLSFLFLKRMHRRAITSSLLKHRSNTEVSLECRSIKHTRSGKHRPLLSFGSEFQHRWFGRPQRRCCSESLHPAQVRNSSVLPHVMKSPQNEIFFRVEVENTSSSLWSIVLHNLFCNRNQQSSRLLSVLLVCSSFILKMATSTSIWSHFALGASAHKITLRTLVMGAATFHKFISQVNTRMGFWETTPKHHAPSKSSGSFVRAYQQKC